MTNYYQAQAVTVNGVLFDTLSTALAYITENYAEWCGRGFTETTLVSVEHDSNDSTVWVKYTHDDEDYANLGEEQFDIKYLEIITTV